MSPHIFMALTANRPQPRAIVFSSSTTNRRTEPRARRDRAAATLTCFDDTGGLPPWPSSPPTRRPARNRSCERTVTATRLRRSRLQTAARSCGRPGVRLHLGSTLATRGAGRLAATRSMNVRVVPRALDAIGPHCRLGPRSKAYGQSSSNGGAERRDMTNMETARIRDAVPGESEEKAISEPPHRQPAIPACDRVRRRRRRRPDRTRPRSIDGHGPHAARIAPNGRCHARCATHLRAGRNRHGTLCRHGR